MAETSIKEQTKLRAALERVKYTHPLPTELVTMLQAQVRAQEQAQGHEQEQAEVADELALADAGDKNGLLLAAKSEQPTQTVQLLEKLAGLANNSQVIRFARYMRMSELKCIFPAFLTPQAQNKKMQDRLMLLIRERACPTLYNYGWIYFQHHQKNSQIQKAFTLLASILEIKEETAREISLQNLFRGNFNRERNHYKTDKIGHLPLVSLLAPPDHRNFAKRLAMHIQHEDISIKAFFKRYGLVDNTPLALDIAVHCFLNHHLFLMENLTYYESALTKVDLPLQVGLVAALLAAEEIKAHAFHQYCLAIYEVFGHKKEDHDIWLQIDEKSRSKYDHWWLRATLATHFHNNQNKTRFYFRYLRQIEKIEFHTDDILLLYFADFAIADNRNNSDYAMYYGNQKTNATPSEHPFEVAEDEEKKQLASKDPADRSIAHIECEQALQKGQTDGVVLLRLQKSMVKNSITFIDFCLQQKRGAFENLKRRFFD